MEITTLVDGGTTTAWVERLLGTYDDLPADVDIWILVFPVKVDRFYPQSHQVDAPAVLLENGNFRSAASFTGDPGDVFEVNAVAAAKEASDALAAKMAAWNAAENFPGLGRDELPGGLAEKDCVAEVTLVE